MIIAANWKMHLSPTATQEYFKNWNNLAEKIPASRKAVFFTPAYSWQVAQLAQAAWGMQNFYPEDHGAFTGENSPLVAKEMGATWALIGHSERRQIFGEDHSLINRKVIKALQLGLKPLLCIGESLEQRQKGHIEIVIQTQLRQALAKVSPNLLLYIAYEPIWAIGTGLVASPKDIRSTHKLIQQTVEDLGFSKSLPVLYGGSVKPENSQEILEIENVSGLLVGGASLKVDSFFKILTA